MKGRPFTFRDMVEAIIITKFDDEPAAIECTNEIIDLLNELIFNTDKTKE